MGTREGWGTAEHCGSLGGTGGEGPWPLIGCAGLACLAEQHRSCPSRAWLRRASPAEEVAPRGPRLHTERLWPAQCGSCLGGAPQPPGQTQVHGDTAQNHAGQRL